MAILKWHRIGALDASCYAAQSLPLKNRHQQYKPLKAAIKLTFVTTVLFDLIQCFSAILGADRTLT